MAEVKRKKNILLEIFNKMSNKIKNVFERAEEILGVDIPDSDERFGKLSKAERAEVRGMNEMDHVEAIEERYVAGGKESSIREKFTIDTKSAMERAEENSGGAEKEGSQITH